MSETNEKSANIENFLDKLALDTFGRTRKGSIRQGIRVSCGGTCTYFRDEISAKEYEISGFCQNCQDKTFG